jgi:hypothetical protein
VRQTAASNPNGEATEPSSTTEPVNDGDSTDPVAAYAAILASLPDPSESSPNGDSTANGSSGTTATKLGTVPLSANEAPPYVSALVGTTVLGRCQAPSAYNLAARIAFRLGLFTRGTDLDPALSRRFR